MFLGTGILKISSKFTEEQLSRSTISVMMMMIMMNCFCGMVDRRKAFSLISSRDNCQSRVWTCAEPEFRLSWMKLCSSDNHYTTAPQLKPVKLQIRFTDITFRHGCSPVNLLHSFRIPFPKNTFGGMLLNFDILNSLSIHCRSLPHSWAVQNIFINNAD